MKFRNRFSAIFITLFFIITGRTGFAENLNGMWAGYYTQYGKQYHMMMFIQHPGNQAEGKISGMIIDARPTWGTLDGISSTIGEGSFENSTFSFVKTYSSEAEALAYQGRIDYHLKMISSTEMKGEWQTSNFTGDVFFKRINPATISPAPSKVVQKPEHVVSLPDEKIAEVISDGDKGETVVLSMPE